MDPSLPPPITHVTQYPPITETSSDLWYERSNLDGEMLACIAYGMHAMLFFVCLNLLWSQRKQRPRTTTMLILYILAHFICGTLIIAGGMLFAEMTWIDNRGYPGGPLAFLQQQQPYRFNYMANVLSTVTAWLQDVLLLYRFFIIFGSRWYAVVLPGCLYLGSIAMGSLALAQINVAGGSFAVSFNAFTAYWSIEVATNLLLTLLIVGKLMYMRNNIRIALGTRQTNPYLTVSAMIVESSLLFTVLGVAFIVSYARNDPFQNILLNLAGQVQSIAPLLIIMRVAQGHALSKRAMIETTALARGPHSRKSEPSVLKFAETTDTSTSRFGSHTRVGHSTTRVQSFELSDVKREEV